MATKAELLKELEDKNKELATVRKALFGLYTAIDPQYVMRRQFTGKGRESYSDQIYQPVLEEIANYNGYSDRSSDNPRPIIVYVREALSIAERALGKHWEGEGITCHLRYSPDGSDDPQYRDIFMRNNGFYFKKKEGGYGYDKVKVEYSSRYSTGSMRAFIEVGLDASGDSLPASYVWDKDRLMWVDPDADTSEVKAHRTYIQYEDRSNQNRNLAVGYLPHDGGR